MASRNAETFRALHQAFNRRDFDSVVGAMAEDVVYHDRSLSTPVRHSWELIREQSPVS